MEGIASNSFGLHWFSWPLKSVTSTLDWLSNICLRFHFLNLLQSSNWKSEEFHASESEYKFMFASRGWLCQWQKCGKEIIEKKLLVRNLGEEEIITIFGFWEAKNVDVLAFYTYAAEARDPRGNVGSESLCLLSFRVLWICTKNWVRKDDAR